MIDVSIIITAYNYARYLDECLDSCLGQVCNGLEYEVIVVDDGSTDGTPSLLKLRSNPRLRTMRIENSGIEIASNVGFRAALGRFIVRVDADDVLEVDYLARMFLWLDQDYDFFYSDYSIINEYSQLQEVVHLPAFDPSEIFSRGDFLATGTLYPARLLRHHGLYGTHSKNSGLENYELIIRMIAGGARGCHIAEPLFQYRRHTSNISAASISRIISSGRELFRIYDLGEFRTNLFHPYKLILPEE
jgi:glycosyltransferase involved in cell wall biosynthesis